MNTFTDKYYEKACLKDCLEKVLGALKLVQLLNMLLFVLSFYIIRKRAI